MAIQDEKDDYFGLIIG